MLVGKLETRAQPFPDPGVERHQPNNDDMAGIGMSGPEETRELSGVILGDPLKACWDTLGTLWPWNRASWL